MEYALDEVFKTEFKYDGEKLHRKLTQPTEELILERNKQLRNNQEVQRDLTFGRQVASIPFNDYEALKRKYPELAKGDSQQRQKTLLRILNSSEGKKYLIRDRV